MGGLAMMAARPHKRHLQKYQQKETVLSTYTVLYIICTGNNIKKFLILTQNNVLYWVYTIQGCGPKPQLWL